MTEIPPPPSSFAVVHGAQPLPPALSGAVVAIGNFDGVHRGHRAVIATARSRAQALGRPAPARPPPPTRPGGPAPPPPPPPLGAPPAQLLATARAAVSPHRRERQAAPV